MSENNGLPKTEFGKVKIFPYPEEIKKVLFLQWDSVPESGMNKNIVLQFIIGNQGFKKIQVLGRKDRVRGLVRGGAGLSRNNCPMSFVLR